MVTATKGFSCPNKRKTLREDKELYRENFEAKLKELKAQMDCLEATAEQTKAEAKAMDQFK